MRIDAAVDGDGEVKDWDDRFPAPGAIVDGRLLPSAEGCSAAIYPALGPGPTEDDNE